MKSILLQVEDIESKVEQLLELYLEDRKRLLAILPPSSPNPSPPSNGGHNNGPPSPPHGSALASASQRRKPRPILQVKLKIASRNHQNLH